MILQGPPEAGDEALLTPNTPPTEDAMNRAMLKSIVVLLALVAGLLWGYQAEPALAAPTTCCTHCNDYCYCSNDPESEACRALPCTDADGDGVCWGVGTKCCKPTTEI